MAYVSDNIGHFYCVTLYMPSSGVILRPGFIYGTRSVGSVKLPLGVIGYPLEMVKL